MGLPNQAVFSTIADLLHILSNHPEYSNRTTSAIQSFVEQTIKKIRDSTCKKTRVILYLEGSIPTCNHGSCPETSFGYRGL